MLKVVIKNDPLVRRRLKFVLGTFEDLINLIKHNNEYDECGSFLKEEKPCFFFCNKDYKIDENLATDIIWINEKNPIKKTLICLADETSSYCEMVAYECIHFKGSEIIPLELDAYYKQKIFEYGLELFDKDFINNLKINKINFHFENRSGSQFRLIFRVPIHPETGDAFGCTEFKFTDNKKPYSILKLSPDLDNYDTIQYLFHETIHCAQHSSGMTSGNLQMIEKRELFMPILTKFVFKTIINKIINSNE